MNILLAVLVMLGVALAAFILLAVLSHYFSVEENPLQKQVRELLPGINCGSCGYKGCDDYAAALAQGEAKPNLCVPGAQALADELSGLLGVSSEPFKDVVAFVACNGHSGATSRKADYEGVASCQAASMVFGGTNSCRFGCLGFGDCANACPNNAICMDDGIARVNTARCVGCGLCVSKCPKSLISMVSQYTTTVVMCHNHDKGAIARKACQNACIACKKCEKTCPHDAIKVIDNLAQIDYTKCTSCGACIRECPTGCLKSVVFPDLTEPVYAPTTNG